MKSLFWTLFTFLFWVVSVQGQTFKFALMSDLHITADSVAENDVRHVIEQINRTPGIDFVIVSGDLSETGDRSSLEKAKRILDGLKPKYYVTSGNHETKWSESGATDFGRIFGSDRFQFEHRGILFLGFNTGPVIRMAEGHVAPQDISWLKDRLQKAGKEKPVIIITHYPLLKRTIGREVGENVKLVNPAYETAKSLKLLLAENNLLNTLGIEDEEPTYDYYVSDGMEKFISFADDVLSCHVNSAEVVDIEAY